LRPASRRRLSRARPRAVHFGGRGSSAAVRAGEVRGQGSGEPAEAPRERPRLT